MASVLPAAASVPQVVSCTSSSVRGAHPAPAYARHVDEVVAALEAKLRALEGRLAQLQKPEEDHQSTTSSNSSSPSKDSAKVSMRATKAELGALLLTFTDEQRAASAYLREDADELWRALLSSTHRPSRFELSHDPVCDLDEIQSMKRPEAVHAAYDLLLIDGPRKPEVLRIIENVFDYRSRSQKEREGFKDRQKVAHLVCAQ